MAAAAGATGTTPPGGASARRRRTRRPTPTTDGHRRTCPTAARPPAPPRRRARRTRPTGRRSRPPVGGLMGVAPVRPPADTVATVADGDPDRWHHAGMADADAPVDDGPSPLQLDEREMAGAARRLRFDWLTFVAIVVAILAVIALLGVVPGVVDDDHANGGGPDHRPRTRPIGRQDRATARHPSWHRGGDRRPRRDRRGRAHHGRLGADGRSSRPNSSRTSCPTRSRRWSGSRWWAVGSASRTSPAGWRSGCRVCPIG